MEVRVPMEMNMGKFSEKLVGLLELAKKKKNVLEYQEISDYFKDQPLDAEQMDKIFDFLEASGVDVLRITENSADDLMLDDDMDIDGLDDEEEVELDKIDLSVPEGVSIEDPVRMCAVLRRMDSRALRAASRARLAVSALSRMLRATTGCSSR